MSQEDKSFLNLEGEFAVASELNRRGIHAAVTYGTSKRADVFAIADGGDRLVRIEVKLLKKEEMAHRPARSGGYFLLLPNPDGREALTQPVIPT